MVPVFIDNWIIVTADHYTSLQRGEQQSELVHKFWWTELAMFKASKYYNFYKDM